MQPLNWYARRLGSMTPGEVAWRLRSVLRDVGDRCRLVLDLHPHPPQAGGGGPGFRVTDLEVGEWAGAQRGQVEVSWRERLVLRAGALAANRLSFLGLRDRHLGDPIDWNRDHEGGQLAPLGFAAGIDYRDPRVTGDAKVVWEPNRHCHLVVLGRAYRATGETRYAASVVGQLDSWLRQCPFGRGMNWRSPLELGIRLINWVWALDLIRDSGLVSMELHSRLVEAVYVHLWEITRKYSRGSSANNHRIGEAAGVFVATSYFPGLDGSQRWREESRRILCDEILKQTYPDGGGREQALAYHLFVLEFLLAAAMVGRWTGRELPPEYWSRLEKMLEFAAALAEGGESLPMFGDADDGYVLDLGPGPRDLREILSVGAVLFGRPDFKAGAGDYAETARWMLGRDSRVAFERLARPSGGDRLTSRAFPDSGYYLLQWGRPGTSESLSVLFDCGDLGYQTIAAHGHADALSFTLRAFRRDVLVDPGTYDYFTYPSWRRYFRSTRAHNTIVIDDTDQSEMVGPFMWGARARARCLAWEPGREGGRVVGEHDGYARLPDPVIHRRTLELDGRARTLTVRDELEARDTHDVSVFFHVSEDCLVSPIGSGGYELAVVGGKVSLRLDPRLKTSSLTGSEQPIAGWVSRGYHQKAPSSTVVGRGSFRGPVTLVSRVAVSPPSGEWG